jgi:hypothetical protein
MRTNTKSNLSGAPSASSTAPARADTGVRVLGLRSKGLGLASCQIKGGRPSPRGGGWRTQEETHRHPTALSWLWPRRRVKSFFPILFSTQPRM